MSVSSGVGISAISLCTGVLLVPDVVLRDSPPRTVFADNFNSSPKFTSVGGSVLSDPTRSVVPFLGSAMGLVLNVSEWTD